jgi:deoxycytidylate deaminase
MERWIEFARKVGLESPHPKFRLGAVVCRGGQVLAFAPNLARWGRCAERRCLVRNIDFRGATIYIVRTNFRMSRPCVHCLERIKETGIKKMVYLNDSGEIVQERLD